jgi:uncharacterized protein (TIGR00369 family)
MSGGGKTNSSKTAPQEASLPKAKRNGLVRYTRSMKPQPFEVTDPNYERRIRQSFSQQGLMKHLGARLTELKPGTAELRADHREELTQQHGYFHAGVSGSLADVACGYAAYTLMPADSSVLTVEYKINLMAPADGEELIARARVVRSGRTLKICTADVYSRKGQTETHCAMMVATVMCLAGKSDGG